MALMRHDIRRAAVLDAANALRAAARVASLLPDDDRTAIDYHPRHTPDLALGLGVPYDPWKFEVDVAETTSMSTRLQDHLRAAVAAQPASLPATRLMVALTALDDAVARRTAALRNHVPMTIYAILVGTALVAMTFAGCGPSAAEASRRASPAMMSLPPAFVVAVTVDLQRSNRGTVEIPLTPLADMRGVLPPPP